MFIKKNDKKKLFSFLFYIFVNNHSKNKQKQKIMSKLTNTLFGLTVGTTIGIGLGVLFAIDKGENTRKKLKIL